MKWELDVSRETHHRLSGVIEALSKWNSTINLVAKSTLADAWRRHILDSAQLHALAPQAKTWVDLGSGAGFPGLVIAILGIETGYPRRTVLIESDQRKAAFLRSVSVDLSIPATVLAQRAETTPNQNADVVSARALAPLPLLLDHVSRHTAHGGVALLPKGVRYNEEVQMARKSWSFTAKVHPSATDPDAVVLEIREVHRA